MAYHSQEEFIPPFFLWLFSQLLTDRHEVARIEVCQAKTNQVRLQVNFALWQVGNSNKPW